MNLARLVTEGLDVLESSISNFINVGQWQKYGLKNFLLKSRQSHGKKTEYTPPQKKKEKSESKH